MLHLPISPVILLELQNCNRWFDDVYVASVPPCTHPKNYLLFVKPIFRLRTLHSFQTSWGTDWELFLISFFRNGLFSQTRSWSFLPSHQLQTLDCFIVLKCLALGQTSVQFDLRFQAEARLTTRRCGIQTWPCFQHKLRSTYCIGLMQWIGGHNQPHKKKNTSKLIKWVCTTGD